MSSHQGIPQSRRQEFVDAARTLYEQKGLSHTSIQDITVMVGASRTLFYHYFPDKAAVTSAVLGSYVNDFVEAMEYWDREREEGHIEDALTSVVTLLRMGLFEDNPFHRALATDENAALYLEFVNRTAERVALFMEARTVQDYARLHELKIHHVHETFYVLFVGLTAYLRNHPNASDEVLKDLIAQSLHMDCARR